MIKHLTFFLCFVFFSCASQNTATLSSFEKPEIFSDEVNRAQLIGTWLGEAPVKDGASMKWITIRHVDGSFKVHFRAKDAKGKIRDQIEAGLWGISGGVYFVITQAYLEGGKATPVDTTDASYYDAYKAMKISPSEFIYKSLSTQSEFTVKRVADDFKF